MGEIVGAGLVSHVPTIMLPESTRFELNEGKEISLVPGLRRLRAEVLDRLRPDTIVVFDTHWYSTFEHLISAHARRRGFYTSDELPRGLHDVPYDFRGDPELACLAASLASGFGTYAYATDNAHLPLHYGTVNLIAYLCRGERVVSVAVVQTGEPQDFLAFGAALGEAVRRLDRRVVLLASGAMSHRFWPLSAVRDHEPSDPAHLRSAEARQADEQRLALMKAGDHQAIIDTMPDYLRHEPEGLFGHYLMMVGAIGGRSCVARGEMFSDYENAVGTGQVHVWFERPPEGWTVRAPVASEVRRIESPPQA